MTKTNYNQGVQYNPETVTDVWETPQDLFNKLNEQFHFTTDVCALPDNAKCEIFFTPDQDGLKQEWTGTCWMNPPYGRIIAKWVKKAYESAQQGATVVCLVPARTCSEWWHQYCMQGEIWFIRHRLKFGGSKINAPFPNAIVIFRPGTEVHQYKAIDRHGNIMSA